MALAYINFGDATGYWDNINGWGDIFILWNNSGGTGYAKLEAGNYDTGVIHGIFESCPAARVGLYSKTRIPINSAFNFGFAKGYKCNSDTQQNCAASPPTCSQKIQTASILDFAIRAADYSTPPAPTGLSVTPGSGNLTFTWNAVSDIFAYHLALTDPSGNVIEVGHKPLDQRTYTFSGLTNGVTYTLHLVAVNHSNQASVEVTKSGTPVTPCVTPGVVLTIPA